MKFPGLLIFLPPENHHGTPLGSVNIFLAENESHIYPNMCATFGCGPTVVSKKGGGGTDRQTETAALYLDYVANAFVVLYKISREELV